MEKKKRGGSLDFCLCGKHLTVQLASSSGSMWRKTQQSSWACCMNTNVLIKVYLNLSVFCIWGHLSDIMGPSFFTKLQHTQTALDVYLLGKKPFPGTHKSLEGSWIYTNVSHLQRSILLLQGELLRCLCVGLCLALSVWAAFFVESMWHKHTAYMSNSKRHL